MFIQPQLSVKDSPDLDKSLEDYFGCQPVIYDATQYLPKLSHLEESFTSVLDLHCLDSDKEIEDKEKNYLSNLEGSNWMITLSNLLRLAFLVAEDMARVSYF